MVNRHQLYQYCVNIFQQRIVEAICISQTLPINHWYDVWLLSKFIVGYLWHSIHQHRDHWHIAKCPWPSKYPHICNTHYLRNINALIQGASAVFELTESIFWMMHGLTCICALHTLFSGGDGGKCDGPLQVGIVLEWRNIWWYVNS